MAENNRIDLAYGEFAKIDTAVSNGIVKEKDLVITKDTSEFIYIRDDKTKQMIRSRIRTFDSEAAAVADLNAASDTYAGQPVAIKNSGNKYQPYTVQNGEDGFIVEPVNVSGVSTGLIWKEF